LFWFWWNPSSASSGAAIVIPLHFGNTVAGTIFLRAIILVALVGTPFWLLTLPLVRYFGDRPSDAHGSARFVTQQEAERLAEYADGLLRRDGKIGKLLLPMTLISQLANS